MLHLPSERIAELADGEGGSPSPGEVEHLGSCIACTRELEAHRRLVAMSSDERFGIAPPLTDWSRLSAALRKEGVMTPSPAPVPATPPATPTRQRRPDVVLFMRRAAAVAVLVGGGAILGRMSAGLPPEQAVALGSSVPSLFGDAGGDPTDVDRGGVELVGNEGDSFASPQAALASLERAQRTYEAAAMYLASHDTMSSADASEQYRTRLAALDRTAETMQQALREAPQDPLINQYYLATMNAREQTLRRLGTVMPVGNRLGRF